MGLAEGSLDGTSRVSEVYQTRKTGFRFEVDMLDFRVALVNISNLLAMCIVQQVYVIVTSILIAFSRVSC